MSVDTETTSLWRTRVIWAALGAGVTALVMAQREPVPPSDRVIEGSPEGPILRRGMMVEPERASASSGEGLEVGRGSALEGAGGELGSELGSGSTGGEHDVSRGGGSSRGSGGMWGETEASGGRGNSLATSDEAVGSGGLGSSGTAGETVGEAEDSGGTTGDDGATAALPTIPLPRMPGTRFMRQVRRPNDDDDGWLITQGLSVPAPGGQIEGFYRSALADQGLRVSGGGRGGKTVGEGYRGALKGRGKHASVELTIHQRPGKLRSIVRIYWRTRP